MTYEQNLKAILDAHLTEIKDEIKDSIIDSILRLKTTGKWIPCSERLPEEIGTYLVTLDYKEYGTAVTTLWFHGKQIGWDLRVADVVIAWQPLPEPYKASPTGTEGCDKE